MKNIHSEFILSTFISETVKRITLCKKTFCRGKNIKKTRVSKPVRHYLCARRKTAWYVGVTWVKAKKKYLSNYKAFWDSRKSNHIRSDSLLAVNNYDQKLVTLKSSFKVWWLTRWYWVHNRMRRKLSIMYCCNLKNDQIITSSSKNSSRIDK